MRRVLLAALVMALVAVACGEEPGAPSEPTVPADTGYGALFDRLPLVDGGPLLALGDLPLAAEGAEVELPPPGAADWQVAGLDRLSQHAPLPPMGVGRALHRLPEEARFRETLGFSPTDVDQWAAWFGGPAQGKAMVMKLRAGTRDLPAFLDENDDWIRQDRSPSWYRPAKGAYPRLEELLGSLAPSELALAVGEGVVQVGRTPDDGDEVAVPAALATQRDTVGGLAGTDRLARQLQGWARGAFVVLEPHQRVYLDGVEPVGEPLEPYRHLALALAVDEAGERTALVLAHPDEATARTNAERLQSNVAAHHDVADAEVRRDGTIVVVDWFRDDVESALQAFQRGDFGILDIAVPAELAGDDR